MIANKRLHWVAKNLVAKVLRNAFGSGYFVSVQNPIYLAASEPEPDVAVLRGSPRDYAVASVPMVPELVVEVADSSVEYDRRQKSPLYARAGIPEYWLVNLETETIEVRRDPDIVQGMYMSESAIGRNGVLSFSILSGVQIAADALLP